MRHAFATAICLGVFALGGGEALAGGDSPVTLGVGAGLGIHKAGGPDAPADTAFVNQANVRLKFLWVLGFDYAYDLGRDSALVEPTPGEPHFQAKMRATALVYPYAGESVALYLGAGIGGASMGDLFTLRSPTNSYHFGTGFEFHLADHVSVDLSFMLVAPGARSVEDSAVARIEAALAAGGPEAAAKVERPGLDEFVSLRNH